MTEIYGRFIGERPVFHELIYEEKRLILQSSLAASGPTPV